MMYAEIIQSNKLGLFLGASIAVHAAVLGVLPQHPEAPDSAAGARPILMRLLPAAMDNSAAPSLAFAGDFDAAPGISSALAAAPAFTHPSPLQAAPAAASVNPAPIPAPRPTPAKHSPSLRAASIMSTAPPAEPAALRQQPLKAVPGSHARHEAPAPASAPAARASVSPPALSAPAPAVAPTPRQTALAAPATNHAAVTSESVERDLSRLSALLHDRIERQRRYPMIARRQRRQGVATVRFDLTPDGDLEAVRLDRSSGYQALDRAALRAVTAIKPFAPAREYLSRAREFSVKVVFKLR